MERGILWLLWLSPFFRLGIFFPLGAWILFFRNPQIRLAGFNMILIQTTVFLFFYALEISYYLRWDLEENFYDFIQSNPEISLTLVYLSGLVIAVANSLSIRFFPRFQKRRKSRKMASISRAFLVWGLAVLLSLGILLVQESLFGTSQLSPLLAEKNTSLSFYISLFLVYYWFFPGEPLGILRWFYSRLVWSGYRRRFFLIRISEGQRPSSGLLHKINRASFFRDNILPGWGHIYAGDLWKGFPILFVFLLSLFFFAIAYFAWDSPVLGIQFLSSWGLKPGISDKEFFQKASNIGYMASFLFLCLFTYVFSKFLLNHYFRTLRTSDTPSRRTRTAGFSGYLPVSVLAHLILLSILFIIPFSLQRKKASEEKKDQARHYQPDRLEFYFIDPNIPDDVKDLNGGVITGTDTPNRESGEKISDEKAGDMGPKSGYIKKIKGKKVPATYSNYISAKMRGPESYLDYWRRAPQPYSCVVAYTITADGYIEDVELIESSPYPDQDLLTLELIESLSPLMPPPTNGKNVRVTELFWNGSLDPDTMPTPLQSEMVTHFDGRYMEEID